jgi:hypothetical protein
MELLPLAGGSPGIEAPMLEKSAQQQQQSFFIFKQVGVV